MSKWITKDSSQTSEIMRDIKHKNEFRYGPLPKLVYDFIINNKGGFTIEDWCYSMGAIARDVKHYLERVAPDELGVISNNFSYLGGIPELDPKEVDETKKALGSMGIEDESIDLEEIEKAVLSRIDELNEKSKNKHEDMT
jgi:hypothetical protein